MAAFFFITFKPIATHHIAMAKAMKAMKVMKKKAAMKAMKAMKKKTVSKMLVLRGSKEKTIGGLTAKDLCKNKHGKVVSKKRMATGKKHPWTQAVGKARKALKITGFVAVKKGTPL